jgi:hypothetical protein
MVPVVGSGATVVMVTGAITMVYNCPIVNATA